MKHTQAPFSITIAVATGDSSANRSITVTGKLDLETYDLPVERFLIDAANEAFMFLANTNDAVADEQTEEANA